MKTKNKRSKKEGWALIVVLAILGFLAAASASFINGSTQSIRTSRDETYSTTTFHLCEAGTQELMLSFWIPFKQNQNYTDLDGRCTGASPSSPMATITDSIPGVGYFSCGVIGYTQVDSYTRTIILRSVGWVDMNGNGKLDAGEPRRIVDITATYKLSRSQVFDYTYFINNYGWMDGFSPSELIVNGDMRANGNFTFSNGTPTVNGSVYAAENDQLIPPVQGLISGIPVKWTDSTYNSSAASQSRWRQGYAASVQGATNSSTYAQWAPLIFDSNASIQGNQLDGAALCDSTGTKGWTYTSTNTSPTTTLLDPSPSSQVIMPDLNDINKYIALSNSYTDTVATYNDGTANPNFGQGAYLNVWNPSLNSGAGAYQTITTNGVLTGSAGVIGTSTHPIVIHGPVTFTQDCVIKGNVSGQGTIYTGRNIHIVGSIIYQNPPDFRGNNMQSIDNSNQKKDALGLAARGSIIMGDVSQFNQSYPLPYMEPPFTHPRYDDYGNLIPAFNATTKDSTGFMLYQSVMGNSYIHSIAQGINEMDCVMYTDFVGGGDIGTGGSGVTINGTIISKDESMVVFSLPMYMNYDQRIKERSMNDKPLIDLQLPRSPVLLESTWQDEGFSFG